jgi:hypothetical protein
MSAVADNDGSRLACRSFSLGLARDPSRTTMVLDGGRSGVERMSRGGGVIVILLFIPNQPGHYVSDPRRGGGVITVLYSAIHREFDCPQK